MQLDDEIDWLKYAKPKKCNLFENTLCNAKTLRNVNKT